MGFNSQISKFSYISSCLTSQTPRVISHLTIVDLTKNLKRSLSAPKLAQSPLLTVKKKEGRKKENTRHKSMICEENTKIQIAQANRQNPLVIWWHYRLLKNEFSPLSFLVPRGENLTPNHHPSLCPHPCGSLIALLAG